MPIQQAEESVDSDERHQLLTQENVRVGFMFGCKALVQLICNFFVGPLTNRSVHGRLANVWQTLHPNQHTEVDKRGVTPKWTPWLNFEY